MFLPLAQIANTPKLPPLPEGPSLKHVRGPVEIPAYEPWQIAVAAIVGLCIVIGLIWLLLRSLKKPAATIPPYEAALAELEAAADLTKDNDEQFAVLSSQALRRYLEDGLGLRFSARTTEEFLRSLKGNTQLDDSYQNELAATLACFDRMKFAQSRLDDEARIRITHTVRELIKKAHQTQQKGADT